MVGILIVSHGRLAEALILSVQFLVGNLQKIRGVSIWPKDKGKEVKGRVRIGKLVKKSGRRSITLAKEVLGLKRGTRW
jgi:hypothetical protein